MRQQRSSQSRPRRAIGSFLLAGTLGLSAGCTTIVLGKPIPCPSPTEAASAQLEQLYVSGVLKDGDPLAHELGEMERYCDYIDKLRGDL